MSQLEASLTTTVKALLDHQMNDGPRPYPLLGLSPGSSATSGATDHRHGPCGPR